MHMNIFYLIDSNMSFQISYNSLPYYWTHTHTHIHTHKLRTIVLGKFLDRKGPVNQEEKKLFNKTRLRDANMVYKTNGQWNLSEYLPTRETGFEFKTSFGCKLAMGPGQIKDSWKSGLGKALPLSYCTLLLLPSNR